MNHKHNGAYDFAEQAARYRRYEKEHALDDHGDAQAARRKMIARRPRGTGSKDIGFSKPILWEN